MQQVLVGKKEICNFVRRSWKTIQEWLDTRGFPAKKINGVWESDGELITQWRRRQITGDSEEAVTPVTGRRRRTSGSRS